MALGSLRGTGLPGTDGLRPFHWRATKRAKMTPKTAIASRALRCQRLMGFPVQPIDAGGSHVRRFRLLEVGERELDVRIPIVVVLLERERDVERRFVLGEEVVALG